MPFGRASAVDGHRRRWPLILGGAFVLVILLLAIPPTRAGAVNLTSKVILFVASPFAPSIKGFDELPRGSKVLAADRSDLGTLGGNAPADPVPLDRIPDHVRKAVLAAEDADFYNHSGVDPSAVLRAVLFNLGGGGRQGGSTITQQLAKLNYVGSQRTYLRKLKEVLYASKLEREYSKDQLLERYLNQVNFGYRTYGIGAASGSFFGVPPERLSPAQAATLAGKIRAPEALDPLARPDRVVNRRNQVLANMRRHEWLTPPQHDEAVASPLGVLANANAKAGGSKAPHFLDFVGREASALKELGGSREVRSQQAYNGGYTIETTLDVKAFDAAVAAVRQQLGAPGDPTTAVVSVKPGDGAIRVLLSGLDARQEYDVASRGRRQPGSSFKPFLYLAALKDKVDPRSTFDSGSPKTVRCGGAPWTVRNYEGSGSGPRTVDEATAQSINTVYAQLMGRVGPKAMEDMAERGGFAEEGLEPAECAMALGGLRHGVTALEQASAFATFAARGRYAAPYAITRILDREGRVVFKRNPKTRDAYGRTEVAVLNGALQRVVSEGTGRAAAIGRPVAGKTGTTENYGNAWFVGYVPQLATAVWVGRPEGDVPMTNVHGMNVSGGSFPARIFSAYMRPALAGLPATPLETASPDELGLKPPGGQPPPPPPPSTTTSQSTTTTTAIAPPSFDPPLTPATPVPTFRTPPPTRPRATTTTTPRPTTTSTSVPARAQGEPGSDARA